MQVCTTWKLCDWPTSFDSLEVLDMEDIVAKPCSEFLHKLGLDPKQQVYYQPVTLIHCKAA